MTTTTKPKHPGGRPRKEPGAGRVVLAGQRVTPATLALLEEAGPYHGGIGKALDELTGFGMEYLRVLYSQGKLTLPKGHPATLTPPLGM